jgi:outer membrane receptor protein involved in Fe transport
MHTFPIQGAAYLQDKLETQGFTMNLGLRLDYTNPKANWWNVDPYDIAFFEPSGNDLSKIFPSEPPKIQWQLSPRLGIAHPITENSKLFFNYGHFTELPQYESMFRVERNTVNQVTSFGNPNLILAKTISYELGFDNILFEDYLLQIAAFYNDISNQQDFTQYFSTAGFSYYASTSNNYEDIRGFEITLRKTNGRWWSGFANYTYQVSSSGHFGHAQQFDNSQLQQAYNDETENLYQNRPIPAPYARLNLNLYTPDDWGPSIFGNKLLGGFRANIVLDWQAGNWTTFNPNNIPSIAYNVQTVDFFNTTLRVEKTVSIGKFSAQLFVDINNVFNTLRLSNTSDFDYMCSLHLPKNEAYDNIPGNDKVGEYRKPGVDWQPEVYQYEILKNDGSYTIAPNDERAIFYEGKSGKYWKVNKDQNTGNTSWALVDQATINQINKDKTYINMPSISTFWFLNPRQIFFGLKLSFNLGE